MVPLLAALAAAFLLASTGASAGTPALECADGSCFPGGGKEATDCFAEFAGVYPNAPFPYSERRPLIRWSTIASTRGFTARSLANFR